MCASEPGGLQKSAIYDSESRPDFVIIELTDLAIEWAFARTSSLDHRHVRCRCVPGTDLSVTTLRNGFRSHAQLVLFMESLILAQDERWRRA